MGPVGHPVHRRADGLNDPQKGWYEGRQEATGDTNAALTLSTNATVLEALFFKHNAGPLFDARRAKKRATLRAVWQMTIRPSGTVYRAKTP